MLPIVGLALSLNPPFLCPGTGRSFVLLQMWWPNSPQSVHNGFDSVSVMLSTVDSEVVVQHVKQENLGGPVNLC